MRRNLMLAALLVIVAGLAWFASRESRQPRLLARASGPVSTPVGSGGLIGWIERGKEGDRAFVASHWGKPKVLLSAAGLTSIALVDGKALIGVRGEKDSQLIAIDLRGGSRQELARTQGEIAQLRASDGVTALVEERAAALPAAPFIAAAGPVSVIRALAGESHTPTIIAAVAAEAGSSSFSRERRVELLGPSRGRIWWVERRGRGQAQRTKVRSALCTGGEASEAISEPGYQQAVIAGDSLLVTAYSPETALVREARAVKLIPLAGGKPKLVADWIRRDLLLMGTKTRGYAQDNELLWQLESLRGRQRVICDRPGGIQDAAMVGDEECLVLRGRKQLLVAERPVTWWARIRHLLERVAYSERGEVLIRKKRK